MKCNFYEIYCERKKKVGWPIELTFYYAFFVIKLILKSVKGFQANVQDIIASNRLDGNAKFKNELGWLECVFLVVYIENNIFFSFSSYFVSLFCTFQRVVPHRGG